MPLYDYKCKKCDHTSTILEKWSERGTKKCDKCNKNTLEPTITVPGVPVTHGCSGASK